MSKGLIETMIMGMGGDGRKDGHGVGGGEGGNSNWKKISELIHRFGG